MKYQSCQISLQEVPGEISLVFSVSGCPHRCKGCHSHELWSNEGRLLTRENILQEFAPYSGLFTCVCFFGGEWDEEHLLFLLGLVRNLGYKTCLYTGADTVSDKLKEHLNYLKTGSWKEELGGLSSITTNQRFINLDNGKCLNFHFQHTTEGKTNAETHF